MSALLACSLSQADVAGKENASRPGAGSKPALPEHSQPAQSSGRAVGASHKGRALIERDLTPPCPGSSTRRGCRKHQRPNSTCSITERSSTQNNPAQFNSHYIQSCQGTRWNILPNMLGKRNSSKLFTFCLQSQIWQGHKNRVTVNLPEERPGGSQRKDTQRENTAHGSQGKHS